MKNIQWKVLVILVVIGLSIFAFYPPDQKVRLGLDLKGGVHLVMRVQTDDALRLETETAMERLREQMKTAGIAGTPSQTAPTAFTVTAVPQDKDAAFRALLTDVELSYSRSSGAGGTYTFTMRPNIAVQLREQSVDQALQTIELGD